MSVHNFYRAFEDKHRGSRALIKMRLEVYMPFVEKIKEIHPDAQAVDIGCGRGEWLELLNENGVVATGVDLDQGMLEACSELKLDAVFCDGIEYLKSLPDSSKSIVSAFHVVEHISFQDLSTFIEEALRVLKAGGLLIMETPNPENFKVAAESFYLDPTHTKPLPSELLSFLSEYHGFTRTAVIRLQENPEIKNRDTVTLGDVLCATSPDYAVLAQKDAHIDVKNKFSDAFEQEIGVSFTELEAKFEHRLRQIELQTERADYLTQKLATLEELISEITVKNTLMNNELLEKIPHLESKIESLQHVNSEVNNAYQNKENELLLIKDSTSWKLTYPLRLIKDNYDFIRTNGMLARVRVLNHKVIQFAHFKLESNPKFKLKLVKLFKKLGLFSLAKRAYIKGLSLNSNNCSIENIPSESSDLGEHSRTVLNDLKMSKVNK